MTKHTHSKPKQKPSRSAAPPRGLSPRRQDITPEKVARGVAAAVVEQVAAAFEPADH
jgi:hypothetical protein